MQPQRRKLILTLGAAPWAMPLHARAADYPERPIQIVVGFPPGQASDVGARIIAEQLDKELGQTVIVNNKAGAMGIIAHAFAKGAQPDGYTVLYGSSGTLAINPSLYRNLPYDPRTDFAPVILLNSSPLFLAVSNDVPVHSLQEMIAYAKANSDTVSYGSSGSGATQHIAMEMLKKAAGIQMLHVPYKGSPPMVTDIIGGRIHFAFDVASSIMPHAIAGRVRLIGVSSAQRLAAQPHIPTIAEQGLTGFEAQSWASLVVPKGTPEHVVQTLNAAANRALQSAPVQAHVTKFGSIIRGGSPEEFADFLKNEIDKWREAVIASGAQLD